MVIVGVKARSRGNNRSHMSTDRFNGELGVAIQVLTTILNHSVVNALTFNSNVQARCNDRVVNFGSTSLQSVISPKTVFPSLFSAYPDLPLELLTEIIDRTIPASTISNTVPEKAVLILLSVSKAWYCSSSSWFRLLNVNPNVCSRGNRTLDA